MYYIIIDGELLLSAHGKSALFYTKIEAEMFLEDANVDMSRAQIIKKGETND